VVFAKARGSAVFLLVHRNIAPQGEMQEVAGVLPVL
jgi:hypothetical protein